MSYVYGQAATTVGPTPTPTTTAAPTTTLPPVTTTTTVVPSGTTTTVMPVTTTPLPVTTTVMPTTTPFVPQTCIGNCTWLVVEGPPKEFSTGTTLPTLLLEKTSDTCSGSDLNCTCVEPMLITGKVVGDTVITPCFVPDPEPYTCGPCTWVYRNQVLPGGSFEINKFILENNACGGDLNANPWCSTCLNPMVVYSPAELLAIFNGNGEFETGCLNQFDKNIPPREPPVMYEGCGTSTCDCTWKLKWIIHPILGQTSTNYWDCVSNCGDNCDCAEPMVLVTSKEGKVIEMTAVGRWYGDVAKGACKLITKMSTKANLSRDQIAMGYGYESMPMGLDTTLDVNGKSMQLTSYMSYVNGQGQVKITSYTDDGTLLNLNIESLESIPGIVKGD